ncbi:MAG: DNA polymerase III subunit delta' [Planctomycetes bacterium HGW-Planctomycetes-1]|nr:MAG: DNA polymerase III subunit delta' [Planctomycetes bacterium HGW-Planctomycetes-1]
MNLSEIFCQDKAVNTLTRAFETGRIPHAYIFEGIDGIGKYTTANVWAKLLLCKSPVKNDACGKCPSCLAFDADSHPDFHHIYKELIKLSNDANKRKRQAIELPVDVIREFLVDKVQLKPSLSESKVFIVSEAEKLNKASQNLLLKTLEEPPNKSFIILLCTKLEDLLPTTKSRCQIVHFRPLSEEKIIEYLAEKNVNKPALSEASPKGEQEAKFWARLTGGSLGQSELLTQLEPSFYGIKKELIERLSKFQVSDAVDFAQWLNSSSSAPSESWQKLKPDTSKSDLSRQAKKVIVSIIISAFTDAMKISFAGADKMTHFDQSAQIKRLAERFCPEDCADIIELCYEMIRFIDASVNEKLVFEHLLLNCADYGIIKVS